MNFKFLLPLLGGVLASSTSFGLSPASDYWEIQDIPSDGSDSIGVLNVAYYNRGGEGVAYHDNNSTMYTDKSRQVENVDGIEYTYRNAGAYHSSYATGVAYQNCFRYDEDVDVTNTTAAISGSFDDEIGDGLGTSIYDLHNICYAETGEWIVYKVNVKTPGYYKVKCYTNSATSSMSSIGMAIINGNNPSQNGNIIRSWADHEDQNAVQNDPWYCFALNHADVCGRMYDGSINPNADQNNFSESWLCWGWTDCGSPYMNEQNDLTVLFKYAGIQDLMVLVSPDSIRAPGDFGNFAFTLKSTDIPDFEFEEDPQVSADSANVLKTVLSVYPELVVLPETASNPLVASQAQVSVYPNPARGEFTIKSAGNSSVDVYDALGAKVVSQSFVDELKLGSGLAKGLYVLRVTNATGTRSFKQEIQ